MTNTQGISALVQCHKATWHFDYAIAVQWARDIKLQGVETTNVDRLASFDGPVNSQSLRFIVSAALRELGLSEKTGSGASLTRASYHMKQILTNNSLRYHLKELMNLAVETDLEYDLTPFFQLHYAWEELEDLGFNYYYEGADLDNIEQIVKEQAHKWIDKYFIHQDNSIDKDHPEFEMSHTARKHPPFSFLKRLWA